MLRGLGRPPIGQVLGPPPDGTPEPDALACPLCAGDRIAVALGEDCDPDRIQFYCLGCGAGALARHWNMRGGRWGFPIEYITIPITVDFGEPHSAHVRAYREEIE